MIMSKKTTKKEKKEDEEEEEEESCSICANDMKNGQPIKTLSNCNHKFHKPCIDQWIYGYNNKSCPNCRREINPTDFPKPNSVTFTAEAKHRATLIVNGEIQYRSPIPFLAISICINNKIITKYINIDFGLRTNNTLGQLKDALLTRSNEISSLRGFFCVNNLVQTSNNLLSYSGLVNHRESSFRITDTYFGSSNSCVKDEEINAGTILNDNTTLLDLYKQYQSKSGLYVNNRRSPFSRIFNNYSERANHTDPDWVSDFFHDPDNPDIPSEFQPEQYGDYNMRKTTQNSLAWLVINLECNTFGGKTRKQKKRRKSTISRKYKNRK